MRLAAEQLANALVKGLSPVYAVCGDAPLLVDEAVGEIRHAARQAGFDERQSQQAEAGFDWGAWASGFDSLSLFANRRLVELRLPTGKPGAEGGKALEAWCGSPPSDCCLIVILPRADRTMQASKWFTALGKAGVVVLVTAPTLEQLPAWIGERLGRHGLKAERETLAFLTTRVEGNLLAAHQEIEKLALLMPPGPLSLEEAQAAVVDVARYDAGDLPEALLKGDPARYCRIIDGLKAEGDSPILALWLLSQELRTLYRLACGVEAGQTLAALMREQRVWESRQPLLSRALKRLKKADLAHGLKLAARTDRAAKGLLREDGWQLLKQLGLDLMGKAALKDEYGY